MPWQRCLGLLVGAILGSAPSPRPCGSWAAAITAITPATMRCSTGRCGRPVQGAHPLGVAASTLMVGMAPWSSASTGTASGAHRDAVRSSRSQLVKASGLRWRATCLGPDAIGPCRCSIDAVLPTAGTSGTHRGAARSQLRRWLPQRSLVLVGDNSYAVLDLLHCCQSLREPVTLIARLRLDAALYAPAPARQPGQNGRPPLKGARRPALKTILDQPQATWASVAVAWYDGTTRTVAVWYRSGKPPVLIRWVLIRDPQGAFATQALLCTGGPGLRWQLEVTFQRTHLGVETQRQWSDLAIARTSPSGNLLLDHPPPTGCKNCPMTQRRAAWLKPYLRGRQGATPPVWRRRVFQRRLPVALYHRLVDSLAYAA